MALFCGVMSFLAIADTFIMYTLLIASGKCDIYKGSMYMKLQELLNNLRLITREDVYKNMVFV